MVGVWELINCYWECKAEWQFLRRLIIYLPYGWAIQGLCWHKQLFRSVHSILILSINLEITHIPNERRINKQVILNIFSGMNTKFSIESVIHTTAEMNLKSTRLRKKSQTQKNIYGMIKFLWSSKIRQN